MKKAICLIVCLSLLMLSLTGCGGKDNAAKKEKKTIMRIATSTANNPTHPGIQFLQKFKEELEKRSDGKVQVRIFYGGQLGKNANDVLGGLKHGSFEMATWALGNFGEYTDAFNPLDIPYLLLNQDVVYRFVDGPVGNMMKEQLLKDTGLKLMAYTPLGFRHITNSKRPVQTPEDLKGLKIRTMTSPLQMAGIRQLGASPAPLAYSEVFTGLQQGVIDGQENPVLNIVEAKFYEVQKYMTLTNHNFTFTSLLINQKFFDGLDKNIQKDILDSVTAADKQARVTLAEEEAKMLQQLGKNMRITKLDNAQLKQFQQVAKGCWPELKGQIGEDKYNKIMTEVDKI